MNGIDAIQSQYIYRVNPVNLFEQRNRQNLSGQNNIFTYNGLHYNLNHPDISDNAGIASGLDILA